MTSFLTILLLVVLVAFAILTFIVFCVKVRSITNRIVRSIESREPWRYTDEEFLDDITALTSAITLIALGYFFSGLLLSFI